MRRLTLQATDLQAIPPLLSAEKLSWKELFLRYRFAPKPMSPDDRAKAIVRLANGLRLKRADWRKLGGELCAELLPVFDSADIADDFRSQLVEWLDVIAAGPSPSRTGIAIALGASASANVLLIPDFDTRGGHHVVALNLAGAIFYSLWIFVDDESGLGSRLGRCEFSECRQFFLRERRGRGAPRKTCKPEHSKGVDREKAAKRSQENYRGKNS